MEQLVFKEGGRPLVNDDFEILQSELYLAMFAQYFPLGACVIDGCAIRDLGGGNYEVYSGLVYIEKGIYRFDGAGSTTLPAEFRLGAAVEQTRVYQSGGSKATTSERKVELRPASSAPGERVYVTSDGAIRLEKAREAVVRENGEVSFFTIFPDQYDANGRGRYGTKAQGWQLLNGKNSQPNAAGKSVVIAGTGAGNEYQDLLGTGGAITSKIEIAHLPAHTHGMESAGSHVHTFTNKVVDGGSNVDAPTLVHGASGSAQHPSQQLQMSQSGNHSHVMQNTGDGKPLDTRDPWLNLGARVWVGLY